MSEKVTSAEEYVKANRKFVKLPSGSVFQIRRVPPELLPDLMSGYDERLTDETWEKMSKEDRVSTMTKMMGSMRTIIPVIVTQPRVVLNGASDDVVNFSDIAFNDLVTLFQEAFDFSEIGKQPEERRANFQIVPSEKPSEQ